MKLNFWQWLGMVLLIVAIVLIARRRMGTGDVVSPPSTTPTLTTAP
jgi:drug/metabolite transporter (DMT)-like permease